MVGFDPVAAARVPRVTTIVDGDGHPNPVVTAQRLAELAKGVPTTPADDLADDVRLGEPVDLRATP